MMLSWLAVLLVACGGGGGSGSSAGSGGSGSGSGGGGSAGTLTADAGADLVAARDGQVTLDGSQSSSSAGAALSFLWRQTRGPDVTGGSGQLTGETPSFFAPLSVDTLAFELTVSAGGTSSAPDTVMVNVLEQDGVAFFVDGEGGSDPDGDGSMENPFASLSRALEAVEAGSSDDVDLYVRTLADDGFYDETGATLRPPAGTSLYGGYGPDWVRDHIASPTIVEGSSRAVSFADVSADAWFSGFDLRAADSANGGLFVSGVQAGGGDATLYIEDNTIAAGDVGESPSGTPGSSYGLQLANVGAVRVLRNTISAGAGAPGQFGQTPAETPAAGGDGESTSGRAGGAGGSGGFFEDAIAGGAGGRGGAVFGGNGEDGESGGALFAVEGGAGGRGSSSDTPGGNGGGGSGGRGARGGRGAEGIGLLSSAGLYEGDAAGRGGEGDFGQGGGGGGGGEGGPTATGGGGGGGGGGGAPGRRGEPGISGGASIGIVLFAVNDSLVEGNTVRSAVGGDGGQGGLGRSGGAGGDGGTGGAASAIGGGEAGGNGGGGGQGGQGGQGGGGAGGPSIAILVGAGIAPVITDNVLASGQGGASGSGGQGGRDGADGEGGTRGGAGAGGQGNATSKAADRAPSEGGYSFAIFDLDPDDGLVPSVLDNTIEVGEAGPGGQAGEQNF